MSNKSSIEWLFQKLWDTPKDKLNWYAILEQAKKMHKEEIAFAFAEGVDSEYEHHINNERRIDPLNYYKKTFRK